MAKARLVVSDSSSAELDQLRRTVNSLLLMLESAAASITATATAEDVLNAWAAAVSSGTDNNPDAIANVVSTNREIVGLKPTPAHPKRPKAALRDMSSNDDF